jgi:hypothetical protein
MKKLNNQIFLPNVGADNFLRADVQAINERLSEQASADYPSVASLNYVPTKGSKEGMVPIRNKQKR